MLTLDLQGANALIEWISKTAKGQPASTSALDEVVSANAFFVNFYSGWDGCSREKLRQVFQYFPQPERIPQGLVPTRLAEGFRQAAVQTDLLKTRLAWVSEIDLSGFAAHILSFLPDHTPLDAVIHITIDLVNNAFVHQGEMGISLLKGLDSRQTFEAVVSHELHHIGFRYWSGQDAIRQRLVQEHTGRSVAVLHVENLLMEGLANFYCTPQYVFASPTAPQPGDAYQARLAKLQREEAEYFARAEAVLAQSLAPGAEFDPCLESLKAIALDMEDMMLPAGHFLGARMVQVIAQCLPQRQIISCVQNLPEFLPLYNQSARQSGGYVFSQQWVEAFDKIWNEKG